MGPARAIGHDDPGRRRRHAARRDRGCGRLGAVREPARDLRFPRGGGARGRGRPPRPCPSPARRVRLMCPCISWGRGPKITLELWWVCRRAGRIHASPASGTTWAGGCRCRASRPPPRRSPTRPVRRGRGRPPWARRQWPCGRSGRSRERARASAAPGAPRRARGPPAPRASAAPQSGGCAPTATSGRPSRRRSATTLRRHRSVIVRTWDRRVPHASMASPRPHPRVVGQSETMG